MSLLNHVLDALKKPFQKKSEDFMDYEDEDNFEEWQPEDNQAPVDASQPAVTSSHSSVMQSFGEMSQIKRLMIMAGLGIVVAGGLIIGIRMVKSPNKGAKAPIQQQATQQNAAKTDASKNNAQPSAALGGTVMVNPFVEVGAGATAAQVAASLPKVPGGSVPAISRYSGNGSLPQIPSYNPRPNIPSGVPMPASAPGSAPQASAPSGNQPTVQGIVTGDDGNNMAIMSDGSVVSAGESYKDGRVAYIGGDGIKFENGSSMKFNQ